MKLLQSVCAKKQDAINLQFPELRAIKENDPNSMNRVAISVFDHWLRDEAEWHLLDCYDGKERESRDRKFLSHWQTIFESTEVYTLRYRGRWPRKSKLVIKKYLDKHGFLSQCKFDTRHSPSQFVILPEFDCIYLAFWDDTNVVYFNSREKADSIINLAKIQGLHCLEFDNYPFGQR